MVGRASRAYSFAQFAAIPSCRSADRLTRRGRHSLPKPSARPRARHDLVYPRPNQQVGADYCESPRRRRDTRWWGEQIRPAAGSSAPRGRHEDEATARSEPGWRLGPRNQAPGEDSALGRYRYSTGQMAARTMPRSTRRGRRTPTSSSETAFDLAEIICGLFAAQARCRRCPQQCRSPLSESFPWR
jgi:hypothetical protein